MSFYDRTELLIGKEKLNKLKNSSVAVFGAGGVGGFCIEALVRSGIGNITVIDKDEVSVSNLNRQIIANVCTVGKDKVDVIKERALSINPELKITVKKMFYLPENAEEFDLSCFDYIVDAIDTVVAKVSLIVKAKKSNVPIISCMGTGGKLYPEKLLVDDIKNTSVCPLARVIRKQLKQVGVDNLKVVYSTEIPVKEDDSREKNIPSMIFVPSCAGMILAREVIVDLMEK